MAKRSPFVSLGQMEQSLGYELTSSPEFRHDVQRFYSDLTPVLESIYDQTRKELEEHLSAKRRPDSAAHEITPVAGAAFLKLPRELRDRIYTYAIPRQEWKVVNADYLGGVNLAGGLGDPTGFYFPLRIGLSLINLNRQIRTEALPLVHRRTMFRLGDMDDFIKLAITVGEVGRENIESLEFAWQSRSDIEATVENEPDIEDPYGKPPTLHAVRCVQLLRQLKRLRFLRLIFPDDLVSNKTDDEIKLNPGIQGLFSIRGIQTVEVRNEHSVSLEKVDVLRDLRQRMES
ncbi:hypothetical protein P170DRAFT_390553, partial [Aspergillus steynii IBT 23096]